MKTAHVLTDLPMRIRNLISTGVVKVMTWDEYQKWKYGRDKIK